MIAPTATASRRASSATKNQLAARRWVLFTRFNLSACGSFIAPGHAATCTGSGDPDACGCVGSTSAFESGAPR